MLRNRDVLHQSATGFVVVVDQVGYSKSLMAGERHKNEVVCDLPCNHEKKAP